MIKGKKRLSSENKKILLKQNKNTGQAKFSAVNKGLHFVPYFIYKDKMKKIKAKNKNPTIKKIAKIAMPILKKNDVIKAGIFGSYARGEQKKKSDLDILIKFDKSLLKLVRLESELKDRFGKKVDLLTYGGIHPLLKERILNEEVRII